MRPAFVMDCSIALAWCFLDEATPATQRLFERMDTEAASVPALWYIELTNVLALSERKRRITADKTAEFIAIVEGFELEVEVESSSRSFSDLLPLCRTHALTCYDAVYLELSMRLGLPLATLDDDLRKAAKKLDVPILGK